MMLRKSTLYWPLLAIGAAKCDIVEAEPGVARCPGGGGILERGSTVPISSLNANVSCTGLSLTPLDESTSSANQLLTANITNGNQACGDYPMQNISLPNDVPLGRIKLTWDCGGDSVYCRVYTVIDPTGSTTPISSLLVSQTCTTEQGSISGSGSAPQPTTNVLMSVQTSAGAVPASVSAGQASGTGVPTMASERSGPPTTSPGDPAAATAAATMPQGTPPQSSADGSATTTAPPEVSAPTDAPVMTSSVGAPENNPASSPVGTGMASSSAVPCPCQNG